MALVPYNPLYNSPPKDVTSFMGKRKKKERKTNLRILDDYKYNVEVPSSLTRCNLRRDIHERRIGRTDWGPKMRS